MTVKLSSYYWFRNNYLVKSLKDKHSERYFFNKELFSEDRKTLKFIIDELDKLKDNSYFQQGKPILNEHVVILNVVELKDVTDNPKLVKKYLYKIHKIMEKYWVKTELYRQLGNCFNEINMKPDNDILSAIEYANNKIRFNEYESLESMCWQTIKEDRKRKY